MKIKKKGWKMLVFSGMVAFFCMLLGGIFFAFFSNRAVISATKQYFFLVRECETTTVSAVAGEVYLAGGAGYLYGETQVVIACYEREENARSVQTSLQGKGVQTEILSLANEEITLYGERVKWAEQITKNLRVAQTGATMLYDVANGLERGSFSQEQARAEVLGVVQSLKWLREGNGEQFPAWNEALSAVERRGREICEGILFCKDLRYLQVQLCMTIVDSEELFGK